MSYSQLVTITKWLLLVVAALAIENAFGELLVSAFSPAAEAAKAAVKGSGLATVFMAILVVVDYAVVHAAFQAILLVYFLLNLARYFVSCFWEFIPVQEAGKLPSMAGAIIVVRFCFFATAQVLVITWQSSRIGHPFEFLFALALLFLIDVVWGLATLFMSSVLQRYIAGRHVEAVTRDGSIFLAANAPRAASWLWYSASELLLSVVGLCVMAQSEYGSIRDGAWITARHHDTIGAVELLFLFITFWLYFFLIRDLVEQRVNYQKILRFLADPANTPRASTGGTA